MAKILYLPSDKRHRHYVTFELGGLYAIKYFGRVKMCQLIQPTPCGYNFLELSTHKCILPRHMYPSKKEHYAKTGKLWFFMNTEFTYHISQIIKENQA